LKDLSIAVTGYSGHLGNSVLEKIVNDIDFRKLYLLGRRKPSPEFFVDNMEYYYLDLIEIEKFGTINVDILVHIAAQTPKRMDENMDKVNINSIDTLIRKTNPKIVIFFSTIDVYPPNINYPIKEHKMLNPISEYGKSKVIIESQIGDLSLKYNFKFIILRITTCYSEKDPHKRVINAFIKQAINKKEITVFGNGEQKRDLLYVDDLAKTIPLIIKDPEFGVFNIGFGHSYSIREIADIVENRISELLGIDVKIKYTKNRDTKSIRNVELDCSKFRKRYNYKPEMTLTKGITRLIHYYRKELLKGDWYNPH
jgi:nucleoside-diphosphate-sugar epimerase